MTNDQLAGYQNNIEQLAQMHINNYFFYDVYDTTSNPFPNVNSFKQEWATWAVDNGQPNPPQIDTLLIKKPREQNSRKRRQCHALQYAQRRLQ